MKRRDEKVDGDGQTTSVGGRNGRRRLHFGGETNAAQPRMPADADADGAAAAAGRFRRRLSARGSWFFFFGFSIRRLRVRFRVFFPVFSFFLFIKKNFFFASRREWAAVSRR